MDTEDPNRESDAVVAAKPELDEAAFERFYSDTSRALWAYIRRLTADPSITDDVHQESYLRFLRHPCSATGESQQSAYLFRIATHLVYDRWRREKRRRGWLERLSPGRARRFPDDRAEAAGWVAAVGPKLRGTRLKIDIEIVLDRLTPRQRALLWLAYVEGYRHREIAEILGLQEASIRVLLSRARHRTAKLLAKYGLDDHHEVRE